MRHLPLYRGLGARRGDGGGGLDLDPDHGVAQPQTHPAFQPGGVAGSKRLVAAVDVKPAPAGIGHDELPGLAGDHAMLARDIHVGVVDLPGTLRPPTDGELAPRMAHLVPVLGVGAVLDHQAEGHAASTCATW